jgi:hypothetical protein
VIFQTDSNGMDIDGARPSTNDQIRLNWLNRSSKHSITLQIMHTLFTDGDGTGIDE